MLAASIEDLGIRHHGIKGQKWGVRRFQNEDGTLTEAGKARYETVSPGPSDYYTVKKGTRTQRYTTNANETGNHRKYVTYTDNDNEIYDSFYPKAIADYNLSPAGDNPDVRIYKVANTLVKDIKVANADAYMSTFIEMYADKSVRDLNPYMRYNDPRTFMEKILGKDASLDRIKAANMENIDAARKSFDRDLTLNGKTAADFLDRMRNKGYDAIEDQYSKRIDGTDGPLIVLDPQKTLRQTSIKELTKQSGFREAVSLRAGQRAFERRDADKKKLADTIYKDFSDITSKGRSWYVAYETLAKRYTMSEDEVDEIVRERERAKKIEHGCDNMNELYSNDARDQGLQHYGTLGMKWGIRRYQNKDGTLTPAGKRRYGTVENLRADFDRKAANKARKIRSRVANAPASASDVEKYGRELKNARLEKKAAKFEEDYKQWMEKRELKAKTLRDVAEEKRKANEAAKAKKEADEAAAAKAERDAYEKAKLDAINSGNPAAIVQYVSGMTTDEINAASDRVGAMRRLDAMIRETDRSALADADGPGSRSTPIANMSVKGMLKEYAKKSIREMLFGDDADGKKENASSGDQAAEEPRKAPAQYGESYMGTMRQTAEAVASAARKKAAENGGSLKDQVEAAAKAYADTMNYAADARANMFEGRAPKKPADDSSGSTQQTTGSDGGGDQSNEQAQSSATSSSGSSSGASRKSSAASFKGAVSNLSKRVTDLNERISGYSDKSVDDIIGQRPTSDMSDANKRLFKNHTAINDLLKKKGLM